MEFENRSSLSGVDGMRERSLGINPDVSKAQDYDRKPKLSEKIWNLTWEQHFPLKIPGTNISVYYSEREEVAEFIKNHFQKIYASTAESSRFLSSDFSIEKENYYKANGDHFIFKDGEKPVGIFVSNPTDWNTYYLRNASILPEYQGKRLYQYLLDHLLKVLPQYNIVAAEGDISPHNHRHIHILNKHGFHVSGIYLSQKWGSLIHFTKFFNSDHQQVFLRQFCDV